MKNVFHKAKKHASHVVKHFKKHKHHYALGIFWSSAVVKMIVLFAGLFSVVNVYNNTFAANPDDGFIISEYIEWSSYNKAIELYNGTNTTIDLSQYKLNLYANWVASPYQSMTLVGTLNPGNTYVVAHSSADPAILAIADITNNSIINFNWDDAISLTRLDTSHVDVFWQIGFDPGSSWNSWWVTTVNRTLVRKATIWIGDANGGDVFDPSLERDEYPQDTFSNLWSHFVDITKPLATINLASGQISPSISLTGTFLITFSEAIDTGTFACDDIDFIWTAPGQTCISITEVSPNNSTTFEVTTEATNDGTIIASIASGKIADIAGNLNGTTTIVNNTITIDRSSLRLSPWDIVIVTANANPDFFEFLVRKHLNAGTIIYFSDNGRNESNAWRTWEWAIIFTTTTSIDAGTIISVQWTDTSSPSLIQNTLGTVSKIDNFDLAVNWDNILVYQWDSYNTPTPIFIYGFGFSISTSWITSGSPTANTSYLPWSLNIGNSAFAYIPWTHKSTQYTCHNTALLSDTFVNDIHTLAYRTGNTDWGYFWPISCTWDTIKPEITIDLAGWQSASTTDFTGKFLFTFSEAIQTSTFTCSDIDFIWTAPGQTCISINEITPNNGTTFEATTTATNIWSIKVSIAADKITDIAGNPNTISIWNNDTITITGTPPTLTYQDGLLVYLPLDSDTNDHSGNWNHWNNHGTFSTTGNVNWAYNFSGNGYITIPQSATLHTSIVNNDFTMSFWWALPDNRDLAIISQSPGGWAVPKWMFAVQEWWHDLGYYSWGDDIVEKRLAQYTFTPHTDLQYYTLVKNWNDFFLYKNASQVGHSNITSPIPLANLGMDFEIGRAENNFYYNNILDEVAIRSRALSVSEIVWLYNWWSWLSLLPTPTYTLTYIAGSNWSISWTAIQTIEENTDWDSIEAIANTGYHFDQRSDWNTNNPRTDFNIQWNISVVALFSTDVIITNNGWSDGLPWTALLKDNCPDWDTSPSYYDGMCEIKTNEETIWHGSAPALKYEARINRATLAKLVVFFAQEILDLEPNTEKSCVFVDIKNETSNDQLIIQQACQLDLMWLQQNGTLSLETFRPRAIVTRNELITTLSRLLFDGENNIPLSSSLDFYTNHTLALENTDIFKNIPERITQSTIVNILKYIYENLNIVERE